MAVKTLNAERLPTAYFSLIHPDVRGHARQGSAYLVELHDRGGVGVEDEAARAFGGGDAELLRRAEEVFGERAGDAEERPREAVRELRLFGRILDLARTARRDVAV